MYHYLCTITYMLLRTYYYLHNYYVYHHSIGYYIATTSTLLLHTTTKYPYVSITQHAAKIKKIMAVATAVIAYSAMYCAICHSKVHTMFEKI